MCMSMCYGQDESLPHSLQSVSGETPTLTVLCKVTCSYSHTRVREHTPKHTPTQGGWSSLLHKGAVRPFQSKSKHHTFWKPFLVSPQTLKSHQWAVISRALAHHFTTIQPSIIPTPPCCGLISSDSFFMCVCVSGVCGPCRCVTWMLHQRPALGVLQY